LAQGLLVGGLATGEWPFGAHVNAPTTRALVDERRSRIQPVHEFEPAVADAFRRAGMKVISNVPRGHAHLGTSVRREIDAIAADVHRRVVWVVEAKDLLEVFDAHRISDRLTKYLGDGGIQDRILERVYDINAGMRPVLEKLNCLYDSDWRAEGILVTRLPDPVSFDRRLRIATATLADVARPFKPRNAPPTATRQFVSNRGAKRRRRA